MCSAHLASSLAVPRWCCQPGSGCVCQLKRNMRACAQQPKSMSSKAGKRAERERESRTQSQTKRRTQLPCVVGGLGGRQQQAGSRSSRKTIFDIFMSIQRIYQVGRLRRLEFVLFASSFFFIFLSERFLVEMEFRAHKVRRRPRRPNPLMPRGACFAPAHRQQGQPALCVALAMAMASSACLPAKGTYIVRILFILVP